MVPDAYLFVMTSAAISLGLGFSRWPNLGAFHERVATRSSVREALRVEGLNLYNSDESYRHSPIGPTHVATELAEYVQRTA